MKIAATLSLVALPLVAACQPGGYVSSIPLTGAESRESLATSVQRAVSQQKACQEEFVEAKQLLDQLQAVDLGEAERIYAELRTQVDNCARSLDAFEERTIRVEDDAMNLFASWEVELDSFSSDIMRQHSAEQLGAAQSGFALLQDELTSVLGKMSTLLDSHRDYVLYFNHNLTNASREVLQKENERFKSNMLDLASECALVEEDAKTFIKKLAGAPSATKVASKR